MAMIVAEISPASKHDRLLTVIEVSASVGRKFSTFNAGFNLGILLPRSRYVFILNDMRFFVKFTFYVQEFGMVHNSVNKWGHQKPSFWQKLGFCRMFPIFGRM
jgi:hypothetical protein